jgi:hypothetical protein
MKYYLKQYLNNLFFLSDQLDIYFLTNDNLLLGQLRDTIDLLNNFYMHKDKEKEDAF